MEIEFLKSKIKAEQYRQNLLIYVLKGVKIDHSQTHFKSQRCLSCLTKNCFHSSEKLKRLASVTRGWVFQNVSVRRCYQSFQSHERVTFLECIRASMFFCRLRSLQYNLTTLLKFNTDCNIPIHVFDKGDMNIKLSNQKLFPFQ